MGKKEVVYRNTEGVNPIQYWDQYKRAVGLIRKISLESDKELVLWGTTGQVILPTASFEDQVNILLDLNLTQGDIESLLKKDSFLVLFPVPLENNCACEKNQEPGEVHVQVQGKRRLSKYNQFLSECLSSMKNDERPPQERMKECVRRWKSQKR
jgi:hypothetical protein